MDQSVHQKIINIDQKIDEPEINKFLDQIKKVREINKIKIGQNKLNAELNGDDLNKILSTNLKIKKVIDNYAGKLNLSTRSYIKIIKISKTISELDDSLIIKEKHLLEALQYRENF